MNPAPGRPEQLYLVERDVKGHEGPYEFLLPYAALTSYERHTLGLNRPKAQKRRKK